MGCFIEIKKDHEIVNSFGIFIVKGAEYVMLKTLENVIRMSTFRGDSVTKYGFC